MRSSLIQSLVRRARDTAQRTTRPMPARAPPSSWASLVRRRRVQMRVRSPRWNGGDIPRIPMRCLGAWQDSLRLQSPTGQQARDRRLLRACSRLRGPAQLAAPPSIWTWHSFVFYQSHVFSGHQSPCFRAVSIVFALVSGRQTNASRRGGRVWHRVPPRSLSHCRRSRQHHARG